jgi:hypothetical protein
MAEVVKGASMTVRDAVLRAQELLDSARKALHPHSGAGELASVAVGDLLVAILQRLDELAEARPYREQADTVSGASRKIVLSTKELAKELGVSESAIRNWAREGMPRIIAGRYDLNEVVMWLRNRDEAHRHRQKANSHNYKSVSVGKWY